MLSFFNSSKRKLKKYKKIVNKINKIDYSNLNNEELQKKANLTKDIHDHFAIVKEAVKRTMNLNPFDVQLIGALSIVDGNISEMKTGEGKSLTAAIAATVLALQKRKVYVVTINDYLVKRDAEEHKPLYSFFNLSVGEIFTDLEMQFYKSNEYRSDIIYSTASELGFDYLRDNMVYKIEDKVQKELDFVIIDEIDSILIDEATTPMIISDRIDKDNEEMFKINRIAKKLKRGEEKEVRNGLEIDKETTGDFILNEKNFTVYLTERGIEKVEQELGIENLFHNDFSKYVLLIDNAIKANFYYKRDVHYVVKDNEIVLVDQSTGRLTPGRQLSEGQHQALEAKEGLPVSPFSVTKGEISYQKFFLLFNNMSGMTGTASTEGAEFLEIYKLEVIEIPTNKPVQRIDKPDKLFITKEEKLRDFVHSIIEIHKSGQPILIGTSSVKTNEMIANELKKNGLVFSVLNANNAEKESEVISRAGEYKAITVATNMAGRGVDIKLSEEAKKAGGLFVLGYERYNNRRIDNQLRGRSGRQGDPGASQFYVSFQDDLLKVYGDTKKIQKRLSALGVGTDKELTENRLFSKFIEKAQKTIENQNFESRKNIVKYDNVIGTQREKIYEIRNSILEEFDPNEKVTTLIDYAADEIFKGEYYDEDIIKERVDNLIGIEAYFEDKDQFKNFLAKVFLEKFEIMNGNLPEIQHMLRYIYLKNIDTQWIEHITTLDTLKEGIHLRSYNQKDPFIEFQKESFYMFQELLKKIKNAIIHDMVYIEITPIEENIKESIDL